LIDTCSKGKLPEQALERFEVMQRKGLLFDMITYSALISACGKGKKLYRGLELFEMTHRWGFVPNVIITTP
jgi:pentatricopeptide repeat domain-containing protein 1